MDNLKEDQITGGALEGSMPKLKEITLLSNLFTESSCDTESNSLNTTNSGLSYTGESNLRMSQSGCSSSI